MPLQICIYTEMYMYACVYVYIHTYMYMCVKDRTTSIGEPAAGQSTFGVSIEIAVVNHK
jgi:hypothetical protein